jgi:hypothetical protein
MPLTTGSGVNGEESVAFTCPASAGGKLTFEWRLWADYENPGVIDGVRALPFCSLLSSISQLYSRSLQLTLPLVKSHKGPCAIYAKQLDSESTSAAGPGWFKLWDEGYDDNTGKWCTEKLNETGDGLLAFNIPPSLPSGNWLFRSELLALHNARAGDPQFYVGCVQVFVESDVTGMLEIPAEKEVSIPGHVSMNEPGLGFNVYNPVFPYPMPGPEVFIPASSSSSIISSKTAIAQTQNRVPENYLIKNANWVGLEVSSYSTEDGCWAAAEECWDQTDQCYDSAPPTGNANCHVWESKCKGINEACDAGNFNGPPSRGIKLKSAEPEPPSRIPEPVNPNAGSGYGEEGGDDDKQKEPATSPAPEPTLTTVQPIITSILDIEDDTDDDNIVTVTATHTVYGRSATATSIPDTSFGIREHQRQWQ